MVVRFYVLYFIIAIKDMLFVCIIILFAFLLFFFGLGMTVYKMYSI